MLKYLLSIPERICWLMLLVLAGSLAFILLNVVIAIVSLIASIIIAALNIVLVGGVLFLALVIWFQTDLDKLLNRDKNTSAT